MCVGPAGRTGSARLDAPRVRPYSRGVPMNVAAELNTFLRHHQQHGHMIPTVGEPTPIGHRLEIACPCGVTFRRWVATQNAVDDLLRESLRAERS